MDKRISFHHSHWYSHFHQNNLIKYKRNFKKKIILPRERSVYTLWIFKQRSITYGFFFFSEELSLLLSYLGIWIFCWVLGVRLTWTPLVLVQSDGARESSILLGAWYPTEDPGAMSALWSRSTIQKKE